MFCNTPATAAAHQELIPSKATGLLKGKSRKVSKMPYSKVVPGSGIQTPYASLPFSVQPAAACLPSRPRQGSRSHRQPHADQDLSPGERGSAVCSHSEGFVRKSNTGTRQAGSPPPEAPWQAGTPATDAAATSRCSQEPLNYLASPPVCLLYEHRDPI